MVNASRRRGDLTAACWIAFQPAIASCFANGAPSLVDRHVGVGPGAGIRIRDHDSAEWRAADDVGRHGR
jgi:hypothetical protein